jgi:phosphoribosylaminoimidazole-succinocarboxamide synthase
MICKRAHVVPIECVVRGYIFGSGWHEYSETGTLAAERLPEGLIIAEKLASPKFTPATKALIGHDENISLTQMEVSIGTHLTSKLIILSHQIFERGSSIAAERGLILADTKFEFGTDADGKIFLIDEVLTPDCSRFWLSDCWIPGSPGPSLDKQPLRDYLKIEMNMGRWNGKTPAPKLPLHMITAICRRYEEFYQRITGAFL